jgi:hypothetical protein
MTLETAFTDYLLAIYRQWYALPYKATRLHLQGLLHAFAKEPGSVQEFVIRAERLSGVARATLAERRVLDAALAATQTLDAAAVERMRPLLVAEDPFDTALSQMVWQPSALRQALDQLGGVYRQEIERIPVDERTDIEALVQHFDDEVPGVRADYGKMLALLKATLAGLAKVRTLRILAWKVFLDAKVKDESKIVNTLGGDVVRPLATDSLSPEMTSVVPESIAPPATTQNAPLFSDIEFPRVIKRSASAWEPLIVRLTTKPVDTSVAVTEVNVAFADPAQPEQVDVVVTAPDFEERFHSFVRTIVVYADRDSQPAIFLVRSNVIGVKRVTVDFYHGGKQVGSAAFETSVQETAQPGRAPMLGDKVEFGDLGAALVPPPDLELRVVRAASENKLYFTLHSANPKVGFHFFPCGSVELVAAKPLDFLEGKFDRLSLLAANTTTDDAALNAEARQAMEVIGDELWEELLPEEFKGKIWEEIRTKCEKGIIRTLQITSDEPWIPWEMVRPYTRDVATEEETYEIFWAERFIMARWLAGRGTVDQVKVRNACLVAPDLDLAYVSEEKNTFDALTQLGVTTGAPLQNRAEVKAVLADGGVQLLHVASHASFNSENPERSPIVLADGELYPEELSASTTRGLRIDRPLVFFNACSAGRLGYGLTGLGGWAEKLVVAGRVGAFVGTLWEVNDRLAATFAQHLYTRLFAGDTLGEALHAARLHVREIDPANPTWLAYTLYGDPAAIFSV